MFVTQKMTRAAKRPRGEPQGLALSELLPTRISTEALKLIEERAKKAGIKASTWARRTLYRELGLLDEPANG